MWLSHEMIDKIAKKRLLVARRLKMSCVKALCDKLSQKKSADDLVDALRAQLEQYQAIMDHCNAQLAEALNQQKLSADAIDAQMALLVQEVATPK